MTVKRFVAPDMRRALDLVRQEMGPDAIILSSQRTAKGVEIITSLEADLPTRGADTRREFGSRFDQDVDRPLESDQAWREQSGIDSAVAKYRPSAPSRERSPDALAQEIEAARERMLRAKKQAREADEPVGQRRAAAIHQKLADRLAREEAPQQESQAQPVAPIHDRQLAGLHAQVKEMRGRFDEQDQSSSRGSEERRMAELQNEIADMRLLLEQQMWRSREQENFASLGRPQLSAHAETLSKNLSRMGLPQPMVNELAAYAAPGKRLNLAWREALAHLSRQLPTDKTDRITQGGVFAFVGPTGVGKTTTIAKLAARYVLEHGQGKVALVTTDTYRVGAHDQLRSLGRILNVPVRVVDQERSLSTVLASLKKFPLILIDTAGFRQGDPLLREQEAMLDSCAIVQRVLVMSCNSQLQTLKASAHAYRSRRVVGCVLTKLDETASLGEVISVAIQQSLPVIYTTHGQEIPNDIAIGSSHNIVARAVALLKGQQRTEQEAVVGGR